MIYKRAVFAALLAYTALVAGGDVDKLALFVGDAEATAQLSPAASEVPPLYVFYVNHTHLSEDTLPYTDPSLQQLDTHVSQNLNDTLLALADVLDRHGLPADWQVVYGMAQGLCSDQGTQNVFQQLLARGHEVGLHVHNFNTDYERALRAMHDVCGISPQVISGLVLARSSNQMAQEIQQAKQDGMDLGVIGMSASHFMQPCGQQIGTGNDMWAQTGNLLFPWQPEYVGAQPDVCTDDPNGDFSLIDHVGMTAWTGAKGNRQADLLTDADFDRLRARFDAALDYMAQNKPTHVAAWGFVTHPHEFMAGGSRGEQGPDQSALDALDRFLTYVDQKVAEGLVVYATPSQINQDVLAQQTNSPYAQWPNTLLLSSLRTQGSRFAKLLVWIPVSTGMTSVVCPRLPSQSLMRCFA